MTILKTDNGYQIEVHGFDKLPKKMRVMDGEYKTLFLGKLSDVTEEQAKEWVEIGGEPPIWHKDYKINDFTIPYPLQSLKSAVNKSWIIVTKTKVQ